MRASLEARSNYSNVRRLRLIPTSLYLWEHIDVHWTG